jgi:Sec-independent protein secretion pathway component TatC
MMALPELIMLFVAVTLLMLVGFGIFLWKRFSRERRSEPRAASAAGKERQS